MRFIPGSRLTPERERQADLILTAVDQSLDIVGEVLVRFVASQAVEDLGELEIVLVTVQMH